MDEALGMQLSDIELDALLPDLNITTPAYAEAFDQDKQVQPASIDLRVDRVVWLPQRSPATVDLTTRLAADLASRRQVFRSDLGERGVMRLKPGGIIMARTLEEFTMPEGHAGQIFTRSSFGRLGLSVTCNAGYINPGYRGHMPLQIVNCGRSAIHLPPEIAICQLVVYKLTSASRRAYGATDLRSKYANDDGGPSRWWLDTIIQNAQAVFGSAALPNPVQDDLIRFVLDRDVSMGDRLERFLPKASLTQRESTDAVLEAFATAEQRSMSFDRLQTWAGAAPVVLLSASIGSLYSTPFNGVGYSWLHYALWTLTIASAIVCVPIYRRKLRQRNVDYFLPADLARIRAHRTAS
ncbi:MAG: dCTP deaminase [Candidatus Eremiobacteraeota bacterium]|nr:dCTP deaminase [Candidatus Eremiobacteraeota bacterium]